MARKVGPTKMVVGRLAGRITGTPQGPALTQVLGAAGRTRGRAVFVRTAKRPCPIRGLLLGVATGKGRVSAT